MSCRVGVRLSDPVDGEGVVVAECHGGDGHVASGRSARAVVEAMREHASRSHPGEVVEFRKQVRVYPIREAL